MQIQTILDVRNYLRRFGYIIYTGDAAGDIEMMKDEIMELYQAKLIEKEDFVSLMNVIATEEKGSAAQKIL